MRKPNLNRIMEDNSDRTGHIRNQGEGSLPSNSWLSQYKMGGGYFPEYHSYAPPRMDYGGDPNQPYHPITNPDGYKQNISPLSVIANAQRQPVETPYQPSQMVNNAKAMLSGSDVATGFSGNPYVAGANYLSRIGNSVGDAYTAGRYAMDGQWGNAATDATEAIIDLVPFRKGKKVVNLSKTNNLPGVYNKMSKLDKSINAGLKVGKVAASADDFMNSSLGKFLFGNPNLIQNEYGGGYSYALGGAPDPCPPGYAYDGELDDCVKLPEGVPQPGTTNPPVATNAPVVPIPVMPSAPSGSVSGGIPGGRGFHGGINLKGTNYAFNYGLDTAPDMRSDLVHNAGISFPNLFNAGKNKGGLDIRGMYAPNQKWRGDLTAGIPLSAKGVSKLSVTGGLGQNIAPSTGMMVASPSAGNQLNWNAAVGYKGRLGKKGPELSIDASYHKAYGGESWLNNYARGGISGSTYEIQSGDTLSDIAERSGVSIDELAALNNIKDVNRIYANQTLNLGTNANRPAMTPTAPAPARVNRPAATPVSQSVQNIVSPRNFQQPVKPVVKPVAKPVQRAMIQPTAKPVAQPVANPSAFKGNYDKGQRLANWKDSRNLESGVVTDKGTNTQYVVQNGKVVKSYPVLTGIAGKNANTDVNKNTAPLSYLESHTEARSTPTGTYFMQPNPNIYGAAGYNLQPIPAYGFNAPEAHGTAMHIPYGTGPKGSHGYDPQEGARRLHALATPTPNDNYASYGCTNTPSGELKCLTQSMFPQGDTAIYVDSRFAKDKNFLQNKFNVRQPRKNKMGGEPCYECGGMYAEGGEGGPGWGDAAWTAAQIADPTGILSYGDAYRGWRDMVQHPSLGNFGLALLNTAAALPVVGKPAKAAVVAQKATKAWKELNALQKVGRATSNAVKTVKNTAAPLVDNKVGRFVNNAVLNPIASIDRGIGLGTGVGVTTAKLLENAPKFVTNYAAPITTAMNRGVRWEKLMSPVANNSVDLLANGLNYAQEKIQGRKYGGQSSNWLNNYK